MAEQPKEVAPQPWSERWVLFLLLVGLYAAWLLAVQEGELLPTRLLPSLVFIGLLVGELGIRLAQRSPVFSFHATVENVLVGLFQRSVWAVQPLVAYSLYTELGDDVGLLSIPETWWATLLCLLFYDLCFYWAHRKAHEVNFMWAAHVVHHQSEEFNLSIAFRQSTFQFAFYFFFALPLAAAGFSLWTLLVALVLHQLYQFWIHAGIERSLGWIELVLITPATHGLHHATNEGYLDKNYAAIFSFWDRLFGTYADVDPNEKPIYGISRPLESYNPLMAIFGPYVELIRLSRKQPSVREILKLWLGPPRLLYQRLESEHHQPRRPAPLSTGWRIYVVGQILTVSAALTHLLLTNAFGVHQNAAWGALLLVSASLLCAGGFLDGRGWTLRAERTRLLSLIVGAAVLSSEMSPLFGLFAVVAVASLLVTLFLPWQPHTAETIDSV